MSNLDMYRKLIEAFDENQKAIAEKKLSEVVGGPLVGWKFILSEQLPHGTLVVSQDVFDAMKSTLPPAATCCGATEHSMPPENKSK